MGNNYEIRTRGNGPMVQLPLTEDQLWEASSGNSFVGGLTGSRRWHLVGYLFNLGQIVNSLKD